MENNFSCYSYHMPTNIVFGNSSLKKIDQYINNRKALLITSKGAVARGLVEKIKSYTPHIVHVISEIKSHPEISDIKLIYNKLQKIDFELILAIGGGSVLDSAKCFAVSNAEKNFNAIENMIRGINQTHKENINFSVKPIISLPTTAGTGSELTPWGSLWDSHEKKKYSIYLPTLFSETAIYDPELTLSVPKAITIQTGLDTLSHALESIWNKNANPITINYAKQAARLIIDYLPKLKNNLSSIVFRSKIMEGCMLAGLAFSHTKTAIAHAMSYYITAHKNIDHGIACSFTLPMIVKAAEKYPEIHQLLQEIIGGNPHENLLHFFDSLEIDCKPSAYDLDQSDIIKIQSTLGNSDRSANSIITFEDLSWN